MEIGTYAGLSTNVILYFLKKHNKNNTLYTTDWYLQDITDDENIGFIENPRSFIDFIKESFIRNTLFFNRNAHIFSYDLASDEFFDAWNQNKTIIDLFGNTGNLGGNIAFAYIDGNHKYEFAKRDFENIDRILITGGYILFDDSAGYTSWGSRDVAIEAVNTGRYKVIKQNPHYFVQKIVND